MSVEPAFANRLRVAAVRLTRRLREDERFEGLTPPQSSAMAALLRHGPMTQQELASDEGVTAPSMSKTIGQLIELGYVERSPHESDGRKLLLTVTSEGHAAADRVRERRNAWLNARLADFTEDELTTMRDALPLLERLTERDV